MKDYKLDTEKFKDIKNLTKETPFVYNYFSKVNNDTLMKQAHTVLYRNKVSIPLWRQALQSAENIIPQFYLLIRLFREVADDSEVTSLTSIRNNNVLSRNFSVLKNGVKDEKLTQYFNKPWMTVFEKECVEASYYGYTPFQIGDIINDEVQNIIPVKREFFNPKTNELLEKYTDVRGISLDDEKLAGFFFAVTPFNWLSDFEGIFSKIMPYFIAKKEALTNLANVIEKYGVPQLVITTNASNEEDLRNIDKYAKSLQNNSYAIVRPTDQVAFNAPATQGSDAFMQLINECKSAISKIILGSDNLNNSTSALLGSVAQSASQSHLFSLNDIRFVEECFNHKLIPTLVKLGLTFLDGCTLEIEKTNQYDLQGDLNIIKDILATGAYKVDAKYLSEKFGIPFENVNQLTTESDV